jgi:putative membrane protein
MSIITIILAILTGLEFIFIFYLETIATTSDRTSKVFNMEKSELARESVTTLFKNQGVYNLLIGVLIFVSLYLKDATWLMILDIYIIVVAAYGSLTSSKDIILKQGSLAILTLITLLIFK